jgi:hypothetical protein
VTRGETHDRKGKGRDSVIRVRRHPWAGITLLAILTPLLAAGPGMPCAGDDVEHHASAGHVMQMDYGHSAHSAPHAGHDDTHQSAVTPAPDAAPETPEPLACSMGMMCSGTVLTPRAATVAELPSVVDVARTEEAWVPHTADLSLPDRPPTA